MVWLMAIVAGIIGALGVIVVVIGLLFTLPYAFAVIANLYGQFCQRTQSAVSRPTDSFGPSPCMLRTGISTSLRRRHRARPERQVLSQPIAFLVRELRSGKLGASRASSPRCAQERLPPIFRLSDGATRATLLIASVVYLLTERNRAEGMIPLPVESRYVLCRAKRYRFAARICQRTTTRSSWGQRVLASLESGASRGPSPSAQAYETARLWKSQFFPASPSCASWIGTKEASKTTEKWRNESQLVIPPKPQNQGTGWDTVILPASQTGLKPAYCPHYL